ncbi:MAG TPA: hypothetical protein VJI46_04535 [Candidatus Nanoarchaeia archaeon]|nr:hypothetical protein [Candidatus Nanoarchaeia archaeon]
MYFPITIWMIVVIIGVIIIFSFIRSLVKALLLLFTFLVIATIVILLVTGVRVYNDFQDLTSDIESSKTLFLLSMEDNFVSGFEKTGDNIAILEESFLSQLTAESISPNPNYQRVFILTEQGLDSLAPKGVSFNGKTLSNEESKEILKSNSPQRHQVFLLLLKDAELDGLSFLMEINSGNIIAYPKSPAIKFLEELPSSFVKSQLSRIKEKMEEKASEFVKEV